MKPGKEFVRVHRWKRDLRQVSILTFVGIQILTPFLRIFLHQENIFFLKCLVPKPRFLQGCGELADLIDVILRTSLRGIEFRYIVIGANPVE